MFLANYGDGLSDLHLPTMVDELRNEQRRRLVAPGAADRELRHRQRCRRTARSHEISASEPDGHLDQRRLLRLPERDLPLYQCRAKSWCAQPFQRLIQQQALLAHKCTGFWQCMDTFKDKQRLEELNQGKAPWKVWSERAATVSISTSGDKWHDACSFETGRRRRRDAADSVSGVPFRRHRNRLRRRNPEAGRRASRTPCFIGSCSAPSEFVASEAARAAMQFVDPSAPEEGPILKELPGRVHAVCRCRDQGRFRRIEARRCRRTSSSPTTARMRIRIIA